MKTLRETQDMMARGLLRHKHALPDIHAELAPLFITDHGAPFEARLNVYHNNVVGNLARAIVQNYPNLDILLGHDFLMSCAREFAIHHPPNAAALTTYGADFPQFLQSHEKITKSLAAMPWIFDVARHEAAAFLCFCASDDAPISEDDLIAMQNDACASQTLALRASAQLMHYNYDVMRILDLCQAHTAHIPPDITSKHTCHMLLLRPLLDVLYIPLAADEYTFLRALQAGNTLESALNQALQENPAFNLTPNFQKHLHLGTYVSRETYREHSK